MGGKTGKILLGIALIGASFVVPGLGLGVALTSALSGALLAQGSGVLLQAFFGKSLESSQQQIEINSANTLAALPVVYGSARLGLRLVDMRVKGNSLYIVGALCHGSENGLGVQAIDEIYFNDKLAFDAAGVAQEGVAKRTENAPPPGGPQVVSLATVTKYLGTDAQTADPDMTSNFPTEWNSDCRGRGVVYVVIKLRWHEKLYPNGIPNVTCVVRGQKVFDPRTSLTVYSVNPALALRDYLTSTRYGVAVPSSEIDDAAIQSVANHAEELINSPDKHQGGSFRKIIAATMAAPCEITTDTNHGLLTGARISVGVGGGSGISGLVGEWNIIVTAPNKMTLTGSSTSGPGYIANSCSLVAYVSQRRFDVGGWLDTGRTPQENLADLLTSCRGNLVYANGKFSLFVRKVSSPTTFALSEANVIGPLAFSTQGVKDAANLIRTKFINPLLQYAPDEIQWPRPNGANPYLTADGGYESSVDLNLPFTDNRYRAEQIGMVILRESRGAIVAELTANEEALVLAVGDVVPVTHSTPGWVAKPFWVMGVVIVGPTAVRLTLLEYSAGAYSLDEQKFAIGGPDTNLPDPTLSGPPTSVAATASSVTGTDGTVLNTMTLTWVAPTVDASPNLDHYQIRYKLAAESEWRPAPDPKLTDLQAIFPGVGVGSWKIQIRAINSLAVSSDWIEASVTVTGGTGTGGSTPATVGGLSAAFVSGNIELKYNANAEVDLAGYEIREGGANWAASAFLAKVDATKFTLLKQFITKRSYTLRVKAFTRSGTYSVADATVVAAQTIPNAGAVGGGDVTVESRLGKLKVFVDLTGTGATQARLYASVSGGFGPVVGDRYAERVGLIDSDRAVFEFTLPTLWFGQTVFCKIGLKDELSDALAEAEQFTSQFSILGKNVDFDNDVSDGLTWKKTLELERNSTWKAGENLIANPSGEAGDFRNWKRLSTGASYVGQDALTDPNSGLVVSVVSDALLPAGAKAFECAGDGTVLVSSELMPVETALRYVLTTWMRQAAAGGSPTAYAGLACYDKNGVRIAPQSYYHPGNFTTTLAAAVNPSDTTITLTTAVNFPDESGSGSNTYIALNVDVAGRTDLPNPMVLRYTTKAGNVLTLNAPVPAGISAVNGSSVRFHRAAGNFLYNPAVNVTVPSGSYAEYTGAIEGEMTLTDALNNTNAGNKFWLGTKYVRAMFLPNSGGTGGTSRLRLSRTNLSQSVRDRDVKDVGASKLGSGSDLSIVAGIKESGGKALNRLLAKALAADPDHLDSVGDGVTYQRPLATALTTGQVDLSKAGVIQKVAANIQRTGGGATLQAIVAKLTDTAEPMRTMVVEGGLRPLIWERSHLAPNGEFEIWESASQPHAWAVDTTAGATCAKESSTVLSGDYAVKYTNPDNATNGGWHGISTNDLVKGAFCLPLRRGVRYRVVASARATAVGGPSFRVKVVHDVGVTMLSTKEFVFKTANVWQTNQMTFTVPDTAEANSKMFVEFNRGGSGSTIDFFLDGLRLEEEAVNDSEMLRRDVRAGQNFVVNGDFAEGAKWWRIENSNTLDGFAFPADGLVGISVLGSGFLGTTRLVQIDEIDPSATANGYLLVPVKAGDELLCRALVSYPSGPAGMQYTMKLATWTNAYAAGPSVDITVDQQSITAGGADKMLMGVVKVTSDCWVTARIEFVNTSSTISGTAIVGRIAAFVRPGRPKVKAYNSGTQTLGTGILALLFDTESSAVGDAYATHDTSTNKSRITVTWGTGGPGGGQGGTISLHGQCTYQGSSSGNWRSLYIRKNGTTVLGRVVGISETSIASDDITLQVCAFDDSYVQGDYYELIADGDNTGNVTISSGEDNTWFRMDLLV